jgi:hypothetical protein
MGNKRRQRNMIPEKVNNHTIGNLVHSEVDEPSITEVRKMMVRIFNKLK